jgi:chromosome segregation ATPase
MIESTDKNTTLTFEQLQQIDISQKRLAVLQSETEIATKTLRGVKSDLDRATKEKDYQEEQLATLTEQIEKKKTELDFLTKEVISGQTSLTELTEKTAVLISEQTIKTDDLNAREKSLVSAENLNQASVENFNKYNELLKEKEKVDTAKQVISKAIETAVW